MSYNDEYTEMEKKRLSSPERLKARVRDIQVNKKQLMTKYKNREKHDSMQDDFWDNLNFLQGVSDEMDEEELEENEFKEKLKNAWDYMTYKFNPLFAPVYMINICVDLMDMAAKAFMLMLENMKPAPKPQQEVDPNAKFFGLDKQKGKEKEFDLEGIDKSHGKEKGKHVVKTKRGLEYDDSYASEMGKQKAEEAEKAKSYGAKVAAQNETRNAGIFTATHSKGKGGSEGSWGPVNEVWESAAESSSFESQPTLGSDW